MIASSTSCVRCERTNLVSDTRVQETTSTTTLLSGCSLQHKRTILGEGDASDGTRVTREVRHIRALLQVPDLHHRILGAGAENQAVGVKLGASQRCSG